MKVICEYCDSYVSADENETCPNCGAPLNASVTIEKTRLKLERIEQEERAERLAKEAKDAQDRDDVFDLIKTIAGSAAGATIAGVAGKAVTEFIKKDLKDSFRK